MKNSNRYLPVNWADGMKINKEHFLSEQRAGLWHQSSVATAWVNELNYGLLCRSSGPVSHAMLVTMDIQHQVRLQLRTFNAVTSGGYLINFNEEGDGIIEKVIDLPGQPSGAEDVEPRNETYYVMLSVNPYVRKPSGEPLLDESQLRAPYTEPDYELQLLRQTELNEKGCGDFHLPVAKLYVRNKRMELDPGYIIPATSTVASTLLLNSYQQLLSFYSSLEVWILQIQQKIVQKKQQNDLAQVIMECCNKLNAYTAMEYQRCLPGYRQQPPVAMLQSIAGFARLFRNTVDIYSGILKDELMAYFSEWCGVLPENLDSTIQELTGHVYQHYDSGEAMEHMAKAIQLFSKLFQALAALDYIGKKREAGIFVKEQLVFANEEEAIRKRRSFLAE